MSDKPLSRNALFRSLLNQERGEVGSADVMSEHAAYPLAPAQAAIFLGERFQEGPSSYHVPLGIRVEGALDPRRLRLALEEVIRRHSILRIRIGLEAGQLVQRLAPAEPIVWETRDCTRETDSRAAKEWVAAFAARPFDLDRHPPLRAALLKEREDLHVVVLVIHHVVFDGRSRQLLIDELVEHYERAADLKAPPLPLPKRQYLQYALECTERARGRLPEAQLEQHSAVLASPDPRLPTDLPGQARTDRPCESVPLSLADAERLSEFVHGERVTSFVLFLAMFNLLLYRYAGSAVRIACPVDCRERPEDLDLIGCFVNTMLFTMDVALDSTVSDYLGRVRREVMLLLSARNEPPRTAGMPGRPAYRAMFAFQERGHGSRRGKELCVESFVLHGATTKCELTMLLEKDGRNTTGAIEYRSDLFSKQAVERLRRKYLALIHHAVENPQTCLRDLLAQVDRGEETPEPLPSGSGTRGSAGPVHERISEWALRAPDRIALENGEEALSYAALDRLSDRGCEALRARGVGLEDRVGVAVDLGIAAVPALLSVMKAGAAYVPLDVHGPRARVAAQVRSSGIRWILCTDATLGGELGGATLLPFGALPLSEPEHAGRPASPDAENLAYVMFTSGSSGRPKGVMITHGGLQNYLSWCVEQYRMRTAPTLSHTSLLSDMTVTTILGPLVAGQRVHIADATQGIEGLRAALLQEQHYAVIKMTPTHLRMLKDEEAGLAGREWCDICILGGEALNDSDVAEWRDARMRLVNEYGPTETVVGSLTHFLEAGSSGGAVPIGVPIRGTIAQLLDPALRPGVAGSPAEICLGGSGVARGYAENPALTAASFLPQDGLGPSGGRMYRTGDLGLRLADGNIQFLGRRDQQIKLRGYRVEPADVEAAISAHPEVRQAAVVLSRDKQMPSLVAHVELERGASCSLGEIRELLVDSLPAHMIPRLLRFVERLPLLPSGKVDRNGVLVREAELASVWEAPPAGADLESQVLAAWREVLGNEGIEPTDNFFDVGGDSPRLYVVYRRLVDMTGHEFPAVKLFEYPTVRSCAEYLGKRGTAAPVESESPQDPEPANVERERLLRLNATLRREDAAP
ncbi:hypothetical protein GCM10009745_41060 [Kribbella yunnanensis]|uniref:Carrier domain-containing protein n=1 Tax=Kribbella yunnanensis TaxID=190194 RepID=A0ABN2HQ03_9ACTN